MFRFLPSGDAPPRYSIINYQRLPNGTFIWRTVGNYMRMIYKKCQTQIQLKAF